MIPGLIDHLWQSTLFAGAAWLLAGTLRNNRAQVRYWVWFIASVKFLVPFSIIASFGTALGSLAPKGATAATTRMEWVSAWEQVGQPLAIPATAARAVIVNETAGSNYATIAIAGLWVVGFVAIAARWRVRWRRVSVLRRSAVPLNIQNVSVPAMSVPGLIEPGVFGIFRPVLLLPEGIEERLTAAQLEAIVAHELCHIRRRDNLTAAIHMAVQAVFWFHPLLWWLGARLVEERERACDEEVLRTLGEPQAYAEGILKVCKLYVESPLTCVSGVTGADLKKRIEAIMSNRVAYGLNRGKKLLLAGAAVLALAGPIVVGIVSAPHALAQVANGTQTAPAASSQFEVASIKRCTLGPPVAKGSEGRGNAGPISSPGWLDTGCLTVADLIDTAYVEFAGGQAHPPQFNTVEGPAWIKSERYQIVAKADGNSPVNTMRGPMLQELLEDRFSLKIAHETREGPIYSLTVTKGGPKLQPLMNGECAAFDFVTPLEPGQKPCGVPMTQGRGSNLTTELLGSLDEFSKVLGAHLSRPVIDRTGITGLFHLKLAFAVGASGNGVADEPTGDSGAVSVFVAIQEQLGLRLESAKGPTEHLVIKSVARPSEN